MLRISTDLLRSGMVLAKPVTDGRGHVLLRQGVSLTQEYIGNLKKRGFPSVYISDGDTDDIDVEDSLSDEVRNAAHGTLARVFDFSRQVSAEFASASSDAVIECVQHTDVKSALRYNNSFEQLDEVVTTVVDDLMGTDAMTGIARIRSHDDVTYGHSIDVSVAAIVLAKQLQVNRRDLERLATGCMLHDIGKIFVSPEVLNKKQPLNRHEVSRLREHTRLGYEMLRARSPDAVMANHVALDHHERQDGHGYPRHLRGVNTIERNQRDQQNILLIVEISTVADVYDTLSVDKPGCAALTPKQIAETMRRMAGTFLNREVTECFLSMLPLLPKGMGVVVRSGEHQGHWGVVVQINKRHPERPLIRLLYDPQGERIQPIDVDLSRQRDMVVEAMLHL
jgi:putative nucleotidyltransferase with HDIG domain